MKKNMGRIIFGIVFLIFAACLAHLGFFQIDKAGKSAAHFLRFMAEAFPPDFSVWQNTGPALAETVEIAFTGTLLGMLLSFPLAVLSLRGLFPAPVVFAARLAAGLTRTVPSLLWAILFVVMVGLGPLAGTLSIAFYTVGYLAKLYAELFEGTDPEVLEAVRGVGASRSQLVRYVLIPENANVILSQLVFMFEYNIRASSILGLVGAGGIGFQIHIYLQTLQYAKLTGVLVLILILVMIMDFCGRRLRSHYLLAK